MPAFAYRKPRDLPETLAVFPLDGALLLPRSVLPLNVFEPRYLNMVDDALAGLRLIGMIQTRPSAQAGAQAGLQAGASAGERPELAGVGCVGRLTSFTETPDGRYLITLTGVCRFAPTVELEASTPYRQVRPSYDRFAGDLAPPALLQGFDRAEMLSVLRAFLVSNDLAADWSSVENAPPETLINSLAMVCPFDAGEKQALLEAPTIDDRRQTLMTLMRMRAVGPDGGVA